MSDLTTTRPRLIPTPRCEPPFDARDTGRTHPQPAAAQAVLPLHFALRHGPTVIPAVPGHPAQPAGPTDAFLSDPDTRRWCATFAQAVVEVLAGERPVAQLQARATRPVHALLERRAALALAQAAKVRPRQVPPQRRRVPARRLGIVHLHRPVPTAVEANVVVHEGGRARALAFRLEAVGGRWVAVALELG